MASPRQRVSDRSAHDFVKRAALVFMVASNWAAVMATAASIDSCIPSTAVIISTSAETKRMPRVHADEPVATSEILTNKIDKNDERILSNTDVKPTFPENTPDSPLINRNTPKTAKASSSEKLMNKGSPSNVLDISENPSLSVSVNKPSGHEHGNRHSRSAEFIGCPETQDNKTCTCSELDVYCDGLNISVLSFLKPLSIDVEFVSATRNRLRTIPMISGAPYLIELALAQNEIEAAANVSELANFRVLENLDLSFNKLQELDLSEGKFLRLRQLNASSNKLTRFESQSLRLTHLYLQRNMLSDVSFLLAFPFLEYLNLSYNRISYIPPLVFKNITRLFDLDLQYNQIINADFAPSITKLLMTLDLCNNNISTFPAKTFQNSNIVFLYLGNNSLTNVDFLVHSSASNIILNGNKLSDINVNIFKNKNHIRALEVSGMNLTSINFVTKIPFLTFLNIESNNISCLPKGFMKNYRSLKEWYLLDNPLEDLICTVSSEWSEEERCSIGTSSTEVQIYMKDENINEIMNCVLQHRNVFQNCEQKCNFDNNASHTLFPSLLIFMSTFSKII